MEEVEDISSIHEKSLHVQAKELKFILKWFLIYGLLFYFCLNRVLKINELTLNSMVRLDWPLSGCRSSTGRPRRRSTVDYGERTKVVGGERSDNR